MSRWLVYGCVRISGQLGELFGLCRSRGQHAASLWEGVETLEESVLRGRVRWLWFGGEMWIELSQIESVCCAFQVVHWGKCKAEFGPERDGEEDISYREYTYSPLPIADQRSRAVVDDEDEDEDEKKKKKPKVDTELMFVKVNHLMISLFSQFANL